MFFTIEFPQRASAPSPQPIEQPKVVVVLDWLAMGSPARHGPGGRVQFIDIEAPEDLDPSLVTASSLP